MGNSAFQAAGSCLRPTLQLGGGRQTRVAPPGPALARSLQRGARYTTSCRAQRAGETRRRTGKRCPTLHRVLAAGCEAAASVSNQGTRGESAGVSPFPSALSRLGVPTPAKRKVKEKEPKLSRRTTSWRSLREGHPLPGHHTRCPHDLATARPPGHRT